MLLSEFPPHGGWADNEDSVKPRICLEKCPATSGDRAVAGVGVESAAVSSQRDEPITGRAFVKRSLVRQSAQNVRERGSVSASPDPHHLHRRSGMFDYSARRRRLSERMQAEGIAALFLAPSADLEYLTGVERHIPNFGEVSYAHGWVTGAFIVPDARSRLRLPPHVRGVRPPGRARGGGRDRQRDRRRRERVRARRRGRRRHRHGGGRRPHLGRDACCSSGTIVGFERLEIGSRARQRAAAGQGRCRARGDGTRDRHGRGRDGRRDAARRPGRRDGRADRGDRARAPAAGSRCPSFTTHMFTGFAPGDYDSGPATAWTPVPEGRR